MIGTSLQKRRHGVYFTPSALVELALERAAAHLAGAAPPTVIDPACGDGAFLLAAGRRWPTAPLIGLELTQEHAEAARARVPRAEIRVGDAFRGGWDDLAARTPRTAPQLWLGNPPYNGTSPLLEDPAAYLALRQRFALDDALPRGTSLRDSYVFFLLLAAESLPNRPLAVLAWITSATWLDSFLYAPVRARLLERLDLQEVIDLGPGAFPEARVRTCLTVWRGTGPSHRGRFGQGDPGGRVTRAFEPFLPEGPEWLLRPSSPEARTLHAAWSEDGEPLTRLLPVHCTGLKTRFDELLVDVDPERLLSRVEAFLRTPAAELPRFAERFGLGTALLPKLHALRDGPGLPETADRNLLRPFFRYRGARHRAARSLAPDAWVYLDRRLIPRGDHRLVGRFDPHAGAVKLVFNRSELPLWATVVAHPGCIPAHRHTRFAPLMVPARVRAEGSSVARTGADLGPLVPNLSDAGLRWAERIGGPLAAYLQIAAFVESRAVQHTWAPAFGRTRSLPVPLLFPLAPDIAA